MDIGHFSRIAVFSAFAAVLPSAANATFIGDTTQNVSYQGSAPTNWFQSGISSVGDVIEGGPEFDTQKTSVSTAPLTFQLGFYTQFGGNDLGAHYADIFIASNPAHPDQFDYAIALGFQAPYGGVAQGVYALSGNDEAAIDRWKNTGYIYGGQYISPNDNLGHDAPTIVTGGSPLAGWSVGVAQNASGDPFYPDLLSITVTAANKHALDTVFSSASFAMLWGTGDCNNDSVYISGLTPPPNKVPEPPSSVILAGGLLAFAFASFRRDRLRACSGR
jgi:hypothetical protein